MTEMDELRRLRLVMLSTRKLRAGACALVESMLIELEGFDDDDPPPEWIPEPPGGMEPLSVGEVRERLRWTLAEFALVDAWLDNSAPG